MDIFNGFTLILTKQRVRKLKPCFSKLKRRVSKLKRRKKKLKQGFSKIE